MRLEIAHKMLAATLPAVRKSNFKPLALAVLDARGALKAFAAEDLTSRKRAEIATGKAPGALAMGLGSRTLGSTAAQRPHFVAAATHAVGGMLVPVAGDVLIRAGIFGRTCDNGEVAAVAGIEAAGLKADPGA